MKERSSIILTKKKYFFINNEKQPEAVQNDHASVETSSLTMDKNDDEVVMAESPRSPPHTKKIRNLCFELEQMRLNSEKERISNYREMVEALITKASP